MKLDSTIDVLRTVAEHLVPYNYPQSPASLEDDIVPLKLATVDVDGYSVNLHFSKSFYQDYYLESLQIFGVHCPFLPFHIVVKIAQRFLGSHELSLVEVPRESRKYYCWTVCVDLQGKPLSPVTEQKGEPCTYEGFDYIYMLPGQFNFY